MERSKKIFVACVMFCTMTAIAGGGCSREPANAPSVSGLVKHEVAAATKTLATIGSKERAGSPGKMSEHANTSSPENQAAHIPIEFNKYGKGVAYIAWVGERVRVVHNGKPGELYDDIEAFTLTLSPDGRRVAYGARRGDARFVVVDGSEKGPFSDRGRIAFSPDSQHVAYDAMIGDKWYLFIDDTRNNGGESNYYDRAVFSHDSRKVLSVETTGVTSDVFKLNVSDLTFRMTTVNTVRSPDVVVNDFRTKVAAVDRKGDKRRVIEFSFDRPASVREGNLYDEVMKLVYSPDGTVLSYIGKKEGKSYLVFNGKEERLPDGEYPVAPVIRPDNSGVGVFIIDTNGAYLQQFLQANSTKESYYKDCGDLSYSKDGGHHAYVAVKDGKFMIVTDGREGPLFDRVISPQFSPDGKYLVYRARQEGKRFVVVADNHGRILQQQRRYERVFETIFTDDATAVAYGVKDGRNLIWKVERLP